MVKSRLGLKALGLCALVLGLMVVAESGVAQAEVGACWGFNKPITKKLECFSSSSSSALEAEPIIEIENESVTLLIATTPVQELLCKKAQIDEGGQFAANGSILLGRVKFKECVFLIAGKIAKPCEPFNGIEKGVILTEKIEGLIVLHKLANGELEPTVLLRRDKTEAGERLVNVHLGPECAVGEELQIFGELILWDSKGKKSFETHAVTHLLEEFPGLHLLRVGGPKGTQATIDGSANVKLGGAHANYEWAGLAA